MKTRVHVQGWAGWAFLICASALVIDSLFLLSTTRVEALVPIAIAVHKVLGVALVTLVAVFAGTHAVIHWRHRNKKARGAGVGLATILVAASCFGVLLLAVGKSGRTMWLVHLHEAAFAAGLLGFGVHRWLATTTPLRAIERTTGAVIALATAAIISLNAYWPARAKVASADPALDSGATRARTVDGHIIRPTDFSNSQYCAGCHPDIAKQWEGSAHRHSSFSDPFYAQTFARMQAHSTADATRFCGGCHDPLVMLAGNMTGNASAKTDHGTAGITCLVCHSVVELSGRQGVGGYVLKTTPVQYPFYGSKNPDEIAENQRLIRSRPEQHKQNLMKPEIHRTPEFCLACHKAHIPKVVNGERWRRGQNDWDPWLESSASMRSAKTFFHAKELKRCQDCHMQDVASDDPAAKDGKIRSHRFGAANSALATVHGDQEWLGEIKKSLTGGIASIDIFAGVPDGGARVFPLDNPDVRWPANKPGTIEVVVRNLKVGHMFPGGTIDLAEVWVELAVTAGKTELTSGFLDERGHLDPDAHRLHNILINKAGGRMTVHEVEEMRTVLYNRALQLGTSDVIRFAIPSFDASVGPLKISARLLHRKFPQDYVEFALPNPNNRPVMPVIAVAERRIEVTIGEVAKTKATLEEADVPRMLDFGIGSLLAGDTKSARPMFVAAAAIRKDDPDPKVFIARVALTDGDLTEAEDALREADRRKPGWWKTAWQLGRLRAAQGKHEEAVRLFAKLLEQFPVDRGVLVELGSASLKLGDLHAAVSAFSRALEVDPEDVDAHSGLSAAYKHLGNEAEAKKHAELAARYRIPREEQAIIGTFRANNKDLDREASDIHVHTLRAARPGERPAAAL